MSEKNDLLDFFQMATAEMGIDYARISRRSKKDPGTAGDEGEENWARLLRQWLPQNYHVVTKGTILFPDGSCSPQIDVFVLAPEIPRGLIDRGMKRYPAHCVVAAFETKLTLRQSHFQKFFHNSAIVKRHPLTELGSPYRELHSPILYGLLAHSFEKMTKKIKDVVAAVNGYLYKHDLAEVQHPKEMPDLICIANMATWTTYKMAYMGPNILPEGSWENIAPTYGGAPCVPTSYVLHHSSSFEQIPDFTPVGAFITSLTRKLAWSNPTLHRVARYYDTSKVSGTAGGGVGRLWHPEDVYSPATLLRVIQRDGLVNGHPLHEWSCGFF